MTSFRTDIEIRPSPFTITHEDKIITMGSCFSDSIGLKLTSNKFKALVNPFGTIYNPLSIHKTLEYAASTIKPDASLFAAREEIHFHYDFPTSFSALDQTELHTLIKKSIDTTGTCIKSCNYIIITYGTAWVYELKTPKAIVANCHKMSPSLFTRRILSSSEIVNSFNKTLSIVRKENSQAKIILTVSPVRHIKDTLPLNSVSKSILRVACQEICDSQPDVSYFPAYEIMMDDLRDYRFYRADMIHPTQEAIDYIWEKFCDCHFNKQTVEIIERWTKIKKALDHKPFHNQTKAHQQFLKATLRDLEAMKEHLPVEEEIASLLSKII